MAIQNNFPNLAPTLLLDFANTERLDPRITFTRATSATYYDGVTTAKAEENLFLYSQQFDDGNWQKQDVTVTANAENAPDGTATGETVTDNATNGVHIVAQTVASFNGGTCTYSLFAKKGTANFVYLRMSNGTSGINAFFNLDTGATATIDSGITASIVSAGNGWYRCTGTWATTASGSSLVSIGIATTDNTRTYVGTGSTIYIWGAQVEQRSAVTAYTATTTQPITNYIPVLLTAAAGVPRFEHVPTTGESLGLEIEEQRTNLVTYSEDFANAAWTKSQSSITSNTIIAPDGTLTGDKLFEDATSNFHQTFQVVSGTTNSNNYTYSCYVKAGERTFARISIIEGTTFSRQVRSVVNLSAGTASGDAVNGATFTSTTITNVGNGWYRVATTGVLGGSDTTIACFVVIGQDASTFNYLGNGYSGIFIWGAQLE